VVPVADRWGATTDLSADAWTQEKQIFDAVLAAAFPDAPQLRQDLDNWANAHVSSRGKRKPTGATIPTQDVDGYPITCQAPVPISVTGSKGRYTSFQGSLDVSVDEFARWNTHHLDGVHR
jgi:hypothetical protein